MKRLHVFNPVAGNGHSPEILKKGAAANEEIYVTSGIGDAERFVYDTCLAAPETHLLIYGGDGTVNEAANGIIKADAGKKALMSVIPIGTGNDFIRCFPEKNNIFDIDAISCNGRYSINILNMGFDCKVVERTAHYKSLPAISGSMAYILGVADVLSRTLGENWEIEVEKENGETEFFDGEFLLALVANGKYYGGGFKAAPLAEFNDGLLDIIIARKISRLTFISLVGDYRKGTHLDPVTRAPLDKFGKFLIYRQCRKMRINNLKSLCTDGEIESTACAEIGVLHNALRIAT